MDADLSDAFVAMAAAEMPGLRRFGFALCSDWSRADDLVQGALERVYVAWPRVHTVADPGAYVRTVLARLAIGESRRPWRREHTTPSMPDTPVVDGTAAIADRLDLAQALTGLTVKQRAAVVLRYIEDRPIAEVAEILGIAPGTVKRQCHDALGHLRARLGAAEEGTKA